MTNIVKKIKNVNTLSLFTKLVGLAVVFSVVSCDRCKKDDDKTKFKITGTEVKDAVLEATVTVEVSEGTAALDQYTLKIDELKGFSGTDYKDAGAGIKPEEFIKVKNADGKTLKELTSDTAELKKGDAAKNIKLELERPSDKCKSATFKVVVMKGTDKKTEAIVKWTEAKK